MDMKAANTAVKAIEAKCNIQLGGGLKKMYRRFVINEGWTEERFIHIMRLNRDNLGCIVRK